MINNNQFKDSKLETKEIKLASSLKIALLAGLFSTVGDALATYAAKLAIEEEIEVQITQQQEIDEEDARIKRLEKQIQALHEKINQLSK
jgi:cell division protein FtsB